MALERDFQSQLIKTIKDHFKGCMVLKLDPNYIQGIPDLLILYGTTWAVLECKKSRQATHRPNQDYYISKMNNMSFGRFVYPENVKEVLDELQQTFEARGQTCVPISE